MLLFSFGSVGSSDHNTESGKWSIRQQRYFTARWMNFLPATISSFFLPEQDAKHKIRQDSHHHSGQRERQNTLGQIETVNYKPSSLELNGFGMRRNNFANPYQNFYRSQGAESRSEISDIFRSRNICYTKSTFQDFGLCQQPSISGEGSMSLIQTCSKFVISTRLNSREKLVWHEWSLRSLPLLPADLSADNGGYGKACIWKDPDNFVNNVCRQIGITTSDDFMTSIRQEIRADTWETWEMASYLTPALPSPAYPRKGFGRFSSTSEISFGKCYAFIPERSFPYIYHFFAR